MAACRDDRPTHENNQHSFTKLRALTFQKNFTNLNSTFEIPIHSSIPINIMSATPHLNLTPIEAGGSTGIPKHEDNRPAVEYDGPSMGWLIRNQKLAHQIIATHHLAPAGNILDNTELAFLRRYAEDPSPVGVQRLTRERGFWNEGENRVDEKQAKEKGSLVGYAICAGGFDDESVLLLRQWFGSGVLDEELKGL
jgi:hypothetical protein